MWGLQIFILSHYKYTFVLVITQTMIFGSREAEIGYVRRSLEKNSCKEIPQEGYLLSWEVGSH